MIAAVVGQRLDKKKATAAIRRHAQENVPQEDRARFIEIVETELMSLHEGNIARYRVRPSEYHAWRANWL